MHLLHIGHQVVGNAHRVLPDLACAEQCQYSKDYPVLRSVWDLTIPSTSPAEEPGLLGAVPVPIYVLSDFKLIADRAKEAWSALFLGRLST